MEDIPGYICSVYFDINGAIEKIVPESDKVLKTLDIDRIFKDVDINEFEPCDVLKVYYCFPYNYNGYEDGFEYLRFIRNISDYKSKLHPLMDCVFTVNGDSMEPDFHNGDLVMVQRLSNCSDLRYGEIGAFSVRNETYIKQYSKRGLVSLNKKYTLMRFNEDESVYLIGRVLGVLDPDAVLSYEDTVRYEAAKARIEEKMHEDD